METSLMLQALRDPLGVPFFPVVFQGLSVLTFALHIFFVNLVVGGALVAAWCHFSKQPWRQKLSRTLAKVTTINLSIAIVLGVAPLLFVQVIYDPFWYTSNLLSAWWALAFLVALILGALAMYVFYLKRRQQSEKFGTFGLISLVCFLFAAVIIHLLSMQSLHPEQWSAWYVRDLLIDTSGGGFNAFHLSRLLHFMAPALLNTGLFLMLYAWYLRPRPDLDKQDLAEIADLGLTLARIGVVANVMIGLWWLLEIPASLAFLTDPALMIAILLAILLMIVLFRAGHDPAGFAPRATALSLLAILVMSATRESLRMAYLRPFDYSIYDYPTSIDWGSSALFLSTFLIGIGVVAYLLKIAFLAGRGEYMVESKSATEPS